MLMMATSIYKLYYLLQFLKPSERRPTFFKGSFVFTTPHLLQRVTQKNIWCKIKFCSNWFTVSVLQLLCKRISFMSQVINTYILYKLLDIWCDESDCQTYNKSSHSPNCTAYNNYVLIITFEIISLSHNNES